MDKNRSKYTGQQFIQQLIGIQSRSDSEAKWDQLRNSSAEMRRSIVDGVIAIAMDRTERPVDRIRALNALLGIIKVCDLVGDEQLEEQLKDLVDRPVLDSQNEDIQCGACSETNPVKEHWLQHTVVIALMMVNPAIGWQKLNHLIVEYDESEFGNELRKTRDRFSGGRNTGAMGPDLDN